MIKRSTWILLGVFLILLVAVIYFQNRPETNEDEIAPTLDLSTLNEVTSIFDLDEDEKLTSVHISANGKSILFGNEGESGWTMVLTDTVQMVDQDTFNQSIFQLKSLTSDAVLAADTDLAAIGLDDPSYQIEILTDAGDSYQIAIGSPTITGSGYYASINDGAPQIVDKFVIDGLIDYLTNPPFQSAPTPEVMPTLDSLDIESGGDATTGP